MPKKAAQKSKGNRLKNISPTTKKTNANNRSNNKTERVGRKSTRKKVDVLEETELDGDTTETDDESCQMRYKEYAENYDNE